MRNKIKLLSFLFILFSCGKPIEPTLEILPNGNTVGIKSITKMFLPEKKVALMLNYQTSLNIDSIDELRLESELLWPKFIYDVEKTGLKMAVISAGEPSNGKFIKKYRTHNFVVDKTDENRWVFSERKTNVINNSVNYFRDVLCGKYESFEISFLKGQSKGVFYSDKMVSTFILNKDSVLINQLNNKINNKVTTDTANILSYYITSQNTGRYTEISKKDSALTTTHFTIMGDTLISKVVLWDLKHKKSVGVFQVVKFKKLNKI